MPGSHDGEIFQHGWFVYARAWEGLSFVQKMGSDCVNPGGSATQDLGSCY